MSIIAAETIMQSRGISRSTDNIFSLFGVLGCVEILAAGLVAFGCLGEFRLLFNKIPWRRAKTEPEPKWPYRIVRPLIERFVLVAVRRKWIGHKIPEHKEHALEKIYVSAVAIGVSVELLALFISIPEAAKIAREAGQANELSTSNEVRVAEITQTNLVLRKKVAELELQLQPRRIKMEQRTNFIFLSQFIPKIPIKILIGQEGNDTEEFAYDLRDMLTAAGFEINSDAGAWGIDRDPTLLHRKLPGTTNRIDLVVFQYSTNVTTRTELFTPTLYKNGLRPPVMLHTNTVWIDSALTYSLQQIGIPTSIEGEAVNVKPDEIVIHVLPK